MFGLDKKTVRDTRSALEQAQDPAETGYRGRVTQVIENILDFGIDGKGPFESAADVAAKALRHRDGNVEAAIKDVVDSHTKLAGAGGFLTSMGGFFTMTVAMPVNVLEFYAISTRMTAAVARLRGYDLEQPQIRSAILLSLVGADAEDLLAKAGIVASGRLSDLAAQRLPGPALMVVNKAVGFRLLRSAGQATLGRFGKSIPFVGGLVGAGLDVYLVRRIADQARSEFPLAPSQITRSPAPGAPTAG